MAKDPDDALARAIVSAGDRIGSARAGAYVIRGRLEGWDWCVWLGGLSASGSGPTNLDAWTAVDHFLTAVDA